MKNRYSPGLRARRFLMFTLLLSFYIFLLILDILAFLPKSNTVPYPFLELGFSLLVGLLFLAIGALVWLYARQRLVASFLLGFSIAMMIAFSVQAGAVVGNRLLSALGSIGAALAILLFAILLLLFPKNYLGRGGIVRNAGNLSDVSTLTTKPRPPIWKFVLVGYVGTIIFLGIATILNLILSAWLNLQVNWLLLLAYIYYVVGLLGILTTVVSLYRHSSSLRERQLRGLFVGGCMLAFAPLLFLTVIPSALNLPFMVDGRISTLTLILLPVVLGYAILRYQILVFDKYIRRTVAWIVGIIGLAIVGYIAVSLLNSPIVRSQSWLMIVIVGLVTIFSPAVWWLAQLMIEHVFFREIIHYRRIIEEPRLLGSELVDLNEAASLLTTAAVHAFETSEACLFVFNDDTGRFQLYPAWSEKEHTQEPRFHFLRRFMGEIEPTTGREHNWIRLHNPLVEALSLSAQPLWLSDLRRPLEERPTGLARYLSDISAEQGFDPLLAPVRVQGKLIGILVLGERGDQQNYAGPDFEAIYLMLGRFAPILETARLYAHASRYNALLNTLYGVNTLPVSSVESIEEAATTYAQIAATAVAAGAELWLYNKQEHYIRRVVYVDTGPQLLPSAGQLTLQESDWQPWFYEGNTLHVGTEPSSEIPPGLSEIPAFPFAWLPLNRGSQHLGILALTYPRPHLFADEEKRVLEMFAVQCATILENTQITLELRAAYERQKELDHLKDQFIMTASHELRTPLTAVLGYIELLKEYHTHLAPEVQADFIMKAHRGCDELVLMVSNIMDASRVHIDVERLKLDSVSVLQSVEHVAEILEAVSGRDGHTLHVAVPEDAFVLADALRLRQVLLNLISNALKYSPLGADVDISCAVSSEFLTISVRDYGLGVPPEAHRHLFERFVRLDRDMNSPVRGAGLGLYISQQLVTAMGGQLWVESEGIPDKGSTFAFTLQRALIPTEKSTLTVDSQHQGVHIS